MDDDKIKHIKQYGRQAKGKEALLRDLQGEQLNLEESILAMCYDCDGYYVQGTENCEISDCPLYPFMPYREAKT